MISFLSAVLSMIARRADGGLPGILAAFDNPGPIRRIGPGVRSPGFCAAGLRNASPFGVGHGRFGRPGTTPAAAGDVDYDQQDNHCESDPPTSHVSSPGLEVGILNEPVLRAAEVREGEAVNRAAVDPFD